MPTYRDEPWTQDKRKRDYERQYYGRFRSVLLTGFLTLLLGLVVEMVK